MRAARIDVEELAIERVRQPCDRMPGADVIAGKGPVHGIPCEAGLHLGVLRDVKRVVVIDEREAVHPEHRPQRVAMIRMQPSASVCFQSGAESNEFDGDWIVSPGLTPTELNLSLELIRDYGPCIALAASKHSRALSGSPRSRYASPIFVSALIFSEGLVVKMIAFLY